MTPLQGMSDTRPTDTYLGLLTFAEVADLCWQYSARQRRTMHERRGHRFCPTRVAPYGERDPEGRGASPLCDGDECLDLFHDLLGDAIEKLRRAADGEARPDDPARYVAGMIPRLLVDRQRSRRVAQGWPARPGRAAVASDKVYARLVASSPDALTGTWYVQLFRILQHYVHKDDRAGIGWPLAGLALEKAATLGRAPERPALIARDVSTVLRLATEAAGEEWMRRTIWRPLMAGQIAAELPVELTSRRPSVEDDALAAVFRDTYVAARRQGQSAVAAFRRTSDALGGVLGDDDAPDAATMALLLEFDRDIDVAGGEAPPHRRRRSV